MRLLIMVVACVVITVLARRNRTQWAQEGSHGTGPPSSTGVWIPPPRGRVTMGKVAIAAVVVFIWIGLLTVGFMVLFFVSFSQLGSQK